MDHSHYELIIEDKFSTSPAIRFIKTPTYMLIVDIKEGPNQMQIILDDADAERISAFFKHWDRDE